MNLLLLVSLLFAFTCAQQVKRVQVPSSFSAPQVRSTDGEKCDDLAGLMSLASVKFGMASLKDALTHVSKYDMEPKSLLVSPAGLFIALGMAMMGADGEPVKALARAMDIEAVRTCSRRDAKGHGRLAIEDSFKTDLGESLRDLVTYLTRGVPDGGDLTISTALFMSKGLQLSRSFSKYTKDYFRGETYTCPFDAPAKAAALVNKWVSKSSGGVVRDIGVKIEASTRVALLQTVVFGAKWHEGFDFRDTERGLYQISVAEKPVHVQYMTKVGTFAFYDTELFEAIALPYVQLGGRGPAFEAILVLPRAHNKTTRTIEDLMGRPWKTFRRLFRERVGHVRIPRIEKVETKLNFERNLERLGFSVDRHLFSQISTGKELPIGEILHHTVFSMTEDGEHEPRPAGSVGKEHFKFYAERPYFVFVQDTKDDILLFSGLIGDPRR